MADWIKIRTEYINGNISYRKLAEKHGVSFKTLQDRAIKDKWVERRKKQRERIGEKIGQKTAEKLAEREANRLMRISKAADRLLEKIEEATEQLDFFLARDKRRYTKKVKDPKTRETIDVYIEEETPKSVRTGEINKAALRQLTGALKDLRDIQFKQEEQAPQEAPSINITVVAATPDDMESDEEE